MPTVLRDGCDLHYIVVGHGPPLLLVPGWVDTSLSWGDLLRFYAQNRTCIAVDPRGSGLSGRPHRWWSGTTNADDLIAILDDAGIEKADVLSNSLGCIAAQILAERHPERVRSLVLLSAWPGLVTLPPNPGRTLLMGFRWLLWRTAIMSRPAPTHLDPHPLPVALPARSAETPSRLQQAATVLTYIGGLQLRRIKAPTLIVHGAADSIVTPVDARIMQHLIQGSRLVRIPRSSHNVMRDNMPAVVSAVSNFLNEHPAL